MIVTALLGNPTDHSVSPSLFASFAQENGFEYAHVKFNIKPENLKKVIRSLPAYGFAGVNITLPYKIKVLSLVDELTEEAKTIGAVNTVVVKNKRLIGDNTDAYGALKAIEKARNRKLSEQDRGLIFGTGGAARAVIWALISRGVKLDVVYREPISERTLELMQKYQKEDLVSFVSYEKVSLELIERANVICNTTSLGMVPNSKTSPFDLLKVKEFSLEGKTLFDAVFNPLQTRFLKLGIGQGAIIADGLEMMIYQGVKAFKLWTGGEVSESTIVKSKKLLASLL